MTKTRPSAPTLHCSGISFQASKEFGPLLCSRNRPKHQAAWQDLIRSRVGLPPSSVQLAERFHTQWHVCHHFLRELVDDDDLLLDIPPDQTGLPRLKDFGLNRCVAQVTTARHG